LGKNAAECLQFACAVGALAATKSGGTPIVTGTEIDAILQSKILTNS
jgi:sugar/nucleoside kinase (ribokinase family)